MRKSALHICLVLLALCSVSIQDCTQVRRTARTINTAGATGTVYDTDLQCSDDTAGFTIGSNTFNFGISWTLFDVTDELNLSTVDWLTDYVCSDQKSAKCGQDCPNMNCHEVMNKDSSYCWYYWGSQTEIMKGYMLEPTFTGIDSNYNNDFTRNLPYTSNTYTASWGGHVRYSTEPYAADISVTSYSNSDGVKKVLYIPSMEATVDAEKVTEGGTPTFKVKNPSADCTKENIEIDSPDSINDLEVTNDFDFDVVQGESEKTWSAKDLITQRPLFATSRYWNYPTTTNTLMVIDPCSRDVFALSVSTSTSTDGVISVLTSPDWQGQTLCAMIKAPGGPTLLVEFDSLQNRFVPSDRWTGAIAFGYANIINLRVTESSSVTSPSRTTGLTATFPVESLNSLPITITSPVAQYCHVTIGNGCDRSINFQGTVLSTTFDVLKCLPLNPQITFSCPMSSGYFVPPEYMVEDVVVINLSTSVMKGTRPTFPGKSRSQKLKDVFTDFSLPMNVMRFVTSFLSICGTATIILLVQHHMKRKGIKLSDITKKFSRSKTAKYEQPSSPTSQQLAATSPEQTLAHAFDKTSQLNVDKFSEQNLEGL